METNAKLKTDVITPKGRVSYPAVFEPKAQMDKTKLKYEITLLFSKKTDIAVLKTALDNAAANEWGPDKKKWPKFKHPAIKDGDEKGDATYAGHWYITPKSNPDRRPQVLNADKSVLVKEDGLFYGGCYARAYINAYAYSTNGSNGVTFGLNAVQKMGDGDRFDSKKDAASVFDVVDDGSDDASNFKDESDFG